MAKYNPLDYASHRNVNNFDVSRMASILGAQVFFLLLCDDASSMPGVYPPKTSMGSLPCYLGGYQLGLKLRSLALLPVLSSRSQNPPRAAASSSLGRSAELQQPNLHFGDRLVSSTQLNFRAEFSGGFFVCRSS